ncbi:peroxidase 57-like [Prosopis cineraria]|uniref:peroxidase 57-like n=1 Tax=Prosopis cineraria TaxID=364024 RepID=UPI00240EE475|nr:peroxidase 57-like [Prosopis cineraria]
MKISLLVCVLVLVLPVALAQLKVGFYKSSCPKAESIVKQVVQKRFNSDRTITAALLRMHFHDCFVQGCDASILIDSTDAEKEAGQNLSVRGFDLIDQVKERLEAACPSTVSCADIITLATRDAVALAGGPKYEVPTGRRDGLVSKRSSVDLPGPDISVQDALDLFDKKGIKREEDMVSLMGGHTVGKAFGRLLDGKTPSTVDNQYYKQILQNKGVLSIDQNLAVSASTKSIVTALAANNTRFQISFANAMIKMGRIQVLVGNAGEIRKKCGAFNN